MNSKQNGQWLTGQLAATQATCATLKAMSKTGKCFLFILLNGEVIICEVQWRDYRGQSTKANFVDASHNVYVI